MPLTFSLINGRDFTVKSTIVCSMENQSALGFATTRDQGGAGDERR
jgi:hypothetical protein